MPRRPDQPPRARIERALLTLALIMEDEDGAIYAPIFERLEHELAALERQESVVARAHRLARQVMRPQIENPAGAV